MNRHVVIFYLSPYVQLRLLLFADNPTAALDRAVQAIGEEYPRFLPDVQQCAKEDRYKAFGVKA